MFSVCPKLTINKYSKAVKLQYGCYSSRPTGEILVLLLNTDVNNQYDFFFRGWGSGSTLVRSVNMVCGRETDGSSQLPSVCFGHVNNSHSN